MSHSMAEDLMRHETPHHLISHRKHGKCNLAYKRNKIIANQKKAYKQEKENTLCHQHY